LISKIDSEPTPFVGLRSVKLSFVHNQGQCIGVPERSTDITLRLWLAAAMLATMRPTSLITVVIWSMSVIAFPAEL
jgi:hypothetical protein